MTQNQIAYWDYVESRRANLERERNNRDVTNESIRHNRVYEGETKRHNQQGEQLGWANLGETKRHNVSQEKTNRKSVNESIRHNKQSERLGWSNLGESRRHNIQSENLGWSNLLETNRHNVASESNDRYRADLNYQLGMYGNQVRYQLGSESNAINSRKNDITEDNYIIGNMHKSLPLTMSYYGGKKAKDVIVSDYRKRGPITSAVIKFGEDVGHVAKSVKAPSLKYRPYSPGWAAK